MAPMSSAALLVALRAELRPLTSIEDAERLREFCSILATEPRYFGPGAQPITPRLTVSRLLHPAGPPCLGAVLGDTVVGIARLEPRRALGEGAELSVAVGAPWRRAGIGTRLVKTVLRDAGAAELGWASMTVPRNNRAAIALARACGMECIDVAVDRFELRAPLGSADRRCA